MRSCIWKRGYNVEELNFEGFGLKKDEPNVTKKRHIYVGGSDVPTIMGINKYKTEFELAQEKAGIVTRPFISNPYIQFGNLLEPHIREYVNAVNGTNFIEESYVNEEKSIRSNVDGIDKENQILLEIKTHGVRPTIKVYEAQMQLYMDQIGCEYGWLAMYQRPKDMDIEFDSTRLNIKEVERDDSYIAEVHKRIEAFWRKLGWLKENPKMTQEEWEKMK